jgi:hypothetical protein
MASMPRFTGSEADLQGGVAGQAFLIWLPGTSLLAAPAEQLRSVLGVVATGMVLMFVARFVLRPQSFRFPRESAS